MSNHFAWKVYRHGSHVGTVIDVGDHWVNGIRVQGERLWIIPPHDWRKLDTRALEAIRDVVMTLGPDRDFVRARLPVELEADFERFTEEHAEDALGFPVSKAFIEFEGVRETWVLQ
jgi:hypothetical protein